MSEKHELDDAVYERIQRLSEHGDSLAKKGSYAKAIENYKEALALLPEPKEDWEASLWLFGSIGDAYFLDRKYLEAFSTFKDCLKVSGAIGNPFIHFRLGQSALEIGETEFAKQELARAYALEGDQIFQQAHPKYLKFIKKFIKT